MVQAIASLWKLVLGICVLAAMTLLATVYRPQSRLFFSRLAKFRFKRGQTEFSVNHTDADEPKPALESRGIQEVAPAPPSAQKSLPPEQEVQDEKTDWATQMYMGFYDENLESAQRAFEKMQEAETRPDHKIQNEAVYLQMRYEKGDSEALQKLKDLAAKSEAYPAMRGFVLRQQAFCYSFIDNLEVAAEVALEAAKVSNRDEAKATNVSVAAGFLERLGKQEEAFKLLFEHLRTLKSDEAKAILYGKLGDLYEKSGNTVLLGLAREKVTGHRPNLKGAHFTAAYDYAKNKDRALAVWHYLKAIEIDSRYANALNNLGVLFGDLKLPKLAIQYYERGIKAGETLSAANLAYVLMEAGATDQAREVLKEARGSSNEVHPNVNHATVRLHTIEEDAKELFEKITLVGRQMRQFLLRCPLQSIEGDGLFEVNGSWSSTEVSDLEVASPDSGKRLHVNWVAEEGGIKERYQLVAQITGGVGGGEVSKFKRDVFAFPPGKGSFDSYGSCLLYFLEDRNLMRVIVVSKDETVAKEFTIKRTPHPPAPPANANS